MSIFNQMRDNFALFLDFCFFWLLLLLFFFAIAKTANVTHWFNPLALLLGDWKPKIKHALLFEKTFGTE